MMLNILVKFTENVYLHSTYIPKNKNDELSEKESGIDRYRQIAVLL